MQNTGLKIKNLILNKPVLFGFYIFQEFGHLQIGQHICSNITKGHHYKGTDQDGLKILDKLLSQ